MEYDFPGNVRELENIISRAAIVSENIIEETPLSQTSARSMTTDHIDILPETGLNIDELTRSLIEQAIQKASGNKTKAAELLGVSRRRLYSMIKSYGL